MVQLHVGTGARRFLLLGALIHLIGGAQAGQGDLGFQNTGAHFHHAVFVRAGKHHGVLVQLRDHDLLAGLDLFQRHKLALGLLFLGTVQQLLCILAGNFAGAHSTGGGVGLFIFLDAAQLVRQGICLVLHTLHQLMGFAAGGFQLFLALFDQGITLFLGAFQGMLCFIAGLFGFVLSGFQLQLQIIQLGQNAVQPLIIVGHMITSGIDDAFRNAQLGTDEKRVGLTGHAHAELVGGGQAFHIKLTAGVHHARGFQRVNFQLGVVGGGHQQGALLTQPFQNADGQRRALCRVGTGTKFVDQGQGIGAGQLQNTGDPLHMAGEGGQALFNALFIADIHQVFIKMADGTAFVRRDQEAVLGHRVQQAGRFDADGFAAGVGAGDDKGIIFFAQGNIHGHDLFLVDQRVAGFFQCKAAAIVHLRHKGVLLHRKAGFGQQQVNLQHSVIAVAELRLQRCHLAGERRQNAGDFLLLLGVQLHNAGVGFHHSGGLHKHGGASGGNIVDDAADFAAVLGTNRHNIAAVADGNHSILQKFVGGRVFDDGIQGDGGGIGHFFRRNDALADLLFQHRLRSQGKEQVIGGQHIVVSQAVPLGQAGKIAQRCSNFQQLAHRKNAALGRMGHHAAHFMHSAKARAAVFQQQGVDGVGLGQGVALLLRCGKRLNGAHHLFGFRTGAQLHRTGNNFIQFQGCTVGNVHR